MSGVSPFPPSPETRLVFSHGFVALPQIPPFLIDHFQETTVPQLCFFFFSLGYPCPPSVSYRPSSHMPLTPQDCPQSFFQARNPPRTEPPPHGNPALGPLTFSLVTAFPHPRRPPLVRLPSRPMKLAASRPFSLYSPVPTPTPGHWTSSRPTVLRLVLFLNTTYFVGSRAKTFSRVSPPLDTNLADISDCDFLIPEVVCLFRALLFPMGPFK